MIMGDSPITAGLSVCAFSSLCLPGTRIGWLSNPFLLLALGVMLGAQALAVYWALMNGCWFAVLQCLFWLCPNC
jgi:hypothetical protein